MTVAVLRRVMVTLTVVVTMTMAVIIAAAAPPRVQRHIHQRRLLSESQVHKRLSA